MSTIDPELTRVLDRIRYGDRIHVKRNNGRHSSRVVGVALAAPDMDPAIGIDLLDGMPHILRTRAGDAWGEVTYLSVMRGGSQVAVYHATPTAEGTDRDPR